MKKLILTSILIVGIVGCIFLPRVLSLSTDWSSDESLWLERSLQFALASQNREFVHTLTSYHPGVTTTALGGFALWLEYGSVLEIAPKLMEKKFLSPQRLAHARLFIAATTGLTLLLAGILLRRLFGNLVATVGTLFLALDPFWLSESRRLHTDALATGFLLLSLLCWLSYLEKKKYRLHDLIGAGISLGLACLSKSLAGAFLFFLPLLLMWYAKQRYLSTERLLWATLFSGTISLITVLLLWPYLWTLHLGQIPMFPLLLIGGFALAIASRQQHQRITDTPRKFQLKVTVFWGIIAVLVLSGIAVLSFSVSHIVFESIYWALTTPHEVPQLFLGKICYAPNLLYYPVYWFVWNAPLTLPFMIYAMWRLWRERASEPNAFRVGVVLVLFGVFYLLGLTVVAKKIARYLVISFPIWNILAAIGVTTLIRRLCKFRRYIAYGVLAVLLFIQAVPVLALHPHYRAYHYPLLPKKWIAENVSLGGGIGLDIAAEYLNRKQDAEQISVRVTPFGHFFEHYFIGQTHISEHSLHTHTFERQQRPDYDIVYIRDKQVDGRTVDTPPPNGIPVGSLQLTEEWPRELEHVVSLNGTDYVWIYRIPPKEE